jgi:hypothetical protein
MDAIAEIKKLYYSATKATINDDIDRAIDLLKTLPNEEERDRVAVYMEGLAQMRIEWSASARPSVRELRRDPAAAASGRKGGKQSASGGVGKPTSNSQRRASAPRPGGPPGRSDRSKAS